MSCGVEHHYDSNSTVFGLGFTVWGFGPAVLGIRALGSIQGGVLLKFVTSCSIGFQITECVKWLRASGRYVRPIDFEPQD